MQLKDQRVWGGWGSMLVLASEKCQLLGSCSEQAGQDDSLEKPSKIPLSSTNPPQNAIISIRAKAVGFKEENHTWKYKETCTWIKILGQA